jgi:YggT family protein
LSVITDLLARVITLVILLFVARAIFSWVLVFGVRNSFVLRVNLTLAQMTEPIIAPLRRYIPPMGGLDLSYMVAVLLLVLVRAILQNV